MKTTLTALFLFACLLVALALANSEERRSGGAGTQPGILVDWTPWSTSTWWLCSQCPSAEEDDMTTLFNCTKGAG
jgi:hypothetical protein